MEEILMSIENTKNRDLFIKACFIYLLNNILKILGIDEEVIDTIPTEYITEDKKENFKILDSLLDFAGLTESGKIIIFEFKKNTLRTKDLKQVYDYYRQVYCKEKTDVISIIIVISKYGEIYEYSELDITFHPQIIKTKEINKQEDLKIIRDKFRNNHKLTSMECTLLSTFPLFDIAESESQIIEEVCTNIKNKKHCIPKDEIEQIVRGMYLNILEYIDPEKQETLMEMIGVEDIKQRGDFAKIRKAERENIEKRGEKRGKKEIVDSLLKNYPLKTVSEMINIPISEIRSIVNTETKY